MNSKLFFILCFFLISNLYAQKLKTKVILGESYGLSYNKANDLFTICEKTTSLGKECKLVLVPDDNIFAFQQKLKESLDKSVEGFKFKIFNKDLKLSDLTDLDYNKINFKIDSLKLIEINDEVEFQLEDAPEGFPRFKLKRINMKSFELSSEKVLKAKDTIIFADDSKKTIVELTKSIQEKIDLRKSEIATNFKDKIKSKFTILLEELYNTSINIDEDYKFLSSESLSDSNSPSVKSSYNFYYLINKKTINVKICKVEDDSNCNLYGPFSLSISEQEFINAILNQHGSFEDGNSDNKTAIGKVYYMIVSKKQDKQRALLKAEINDSITNIFEKIENAKNTYSGQFVINKNVPLYKSEVNKSRSLWFDSYKDVKQDKDVVELIIDSVNIRFFNNRADNITIVGRLSNDIENTRVFTNRNYSLPLREFTHRTQKNTLVDRVGDTLTYYYDDVLDYLPHDKYNYAVKNSEIKIKENDSVKVVERKIGDYFTGIFFSDFLGLNSNNSNSLIVAEGRIRIPWHLRNYGKNTFFDNITAYASVNLFSGFENSSRKIELEDSYDPDETSEVNSDKFKTDNFNLLSNNNIDAGVLVTPYTFEWKGASTFIHLRYGIRFLRTGAEYNLKESNTILIDSIPTVEETIIERKGFQVFSIGQELEINFEIRPQSSVGADITVGMNWFRANGTNENDVEFSTFNNAPNLKFMTNIYALTNSDESNSGVYFRIGGHYNLGTYKVFPQMMVGYATNLSSFVNKLKKEN